MRTITNHFLEAFVGHSVRVICLLNWYESFVLTRPYVLRLVLNALLPSALCLMSHVSCLSRPALVLIPCGLCFVSSSMRQDGKAHLIFQRSEQALNVRGVLGVLETWTFLIVSQSFRLCIVKSV